jgi:protocatechuate 3,4-dioxygenase, beta subunit
MSIVPTPWIGRRTVLTGLSASTGSLVLAASPLLGRPALTPTPRQTEGPFYPTDWKGDIDNDLVVVTGEGARALGQVVHVQGRVENLSGEPLGGAVVEIWQCDSHGIYRHPRDEQGARHHDPGFQGRGRTVADAAGEYHFRTIRPTGWRRARWRRVSTS